MTLEPAARHVPQYAREKDRPYVGSPWDRQDREPPRAYSCFLIYRDMEPDERTLKGAERIYRERNGMRTDNCKGQLAYKWNANHRWEERAEAWDNYLAAKKQAALKRRAIRTAEKHADMAADALMVAAAPSTKLADRMREQLEREGADFLDKLTDEDLMKLHKVFGDSIPMFQKAEREALGSAGDATPAPAKLNAKAQKLRAIMGNKTVMGLLESTVIEVSSEESSPSDLTD